MISYRFFFIRVLVSVLDITYNEKSQHPATTVAPSSPIATEEILNVVDGGWVLWITVPTLSKHTSEFSVPA
jgi:hypothetical protein